ncbi:hypothetical protein V8O11_22850 [Erwinia aphidicola]|uniref:hypothetical protein n=1 Tax=Erwinia aphidicola TaxID=68334 RepID=UPI00300C59A9
MKSIRLTVLKFWRLPGCVLAICISSLIALYFSSHHPVISDGTCQWEVTTLAGVPDKAINERNGVLGKFEQQPDGDIWLMGLDTSVEGASHCLLHKGYTARQLSMIAPR